MNKGNDFTWADFLEVRASLIKQWRKDGRAFDDIARSLSCDPEQAQLIDKTDGPIGMPGSTLSDRLNRAALAHKLQDALRSKSEKSGES